MSTNSFDSTTTIRLDPVSPLHGRSVNSLGWMTRETIRVGPYFRVCRGRPLTGSQNARVDDSTQRHDYVIKVANPGDEMSIDEARRLLAREATAASAVTSPHVAPCLVRELTAPLPYLVFPYLGEATIDSVSKQPLVIPEALWVARQVAQGLLAIHGAGWLNLDLNANNVIIGEDGHVTIIDLAFAVPRGRKPRMTFAAHPAYASPELFSSEPPTPAADIYSLGLLLYQMLAGAQPFTSDSFAGWRIIHREQIATPVHEVRKGLPDRLGKFVARMISKTPERRPALDETIEEIASWETQTFHLRSGAAPLSSRLRTGVNTHRSVVKTVQQ